MRKLVKIEVSESDDTLLAVDDKGEIYPAAYSVMSSLAEEQGETVTAFISRQIGWWGACSEDFKIGVSDWQTIYEAEQ